MSDTSARWTLRDLPFAARLTIAAFLISVGIGYLSALVNLHFAEASPGNALPSLDDVVVAYSGKTGISQWERLLVAPAHLPFNGQGSMRSVFTKARVGGWNAMVKRKAKELKLDLEDPAHLKRIEAGVHADLDGERLALIYWGREAPADREKVYEEDNFPIPAALKNKPINQKFVNGNTVQVKSIIDSRCLRCHAENVNGPGAQYPLDKYESVSLYTNSEGPTGKSLAKLALTTHVHLLGFAVLYGLTGLLFALTRWPNVIRVPIAPLALVAQVVDIAFWWLARVDEPHGPMFARLIPFSGTIVAGALLLQILLILWDITLSKLGRVVLLMLVIGAAVGGYQVKKEYIDPYLASQKVQAEEGNLLGGE